jgi:hypothetical protein
MPRLPPVTRMMPSDAMNFHPCSSQTDSCAQTDERSAFRHFAERRAFGNAEHALVRAKCSKMSNTYAAWRTIMVCPDRRRCAP